jgi:uncharacterized protein
MPAPTPIALTARQARLLHLAAQGLLTAQPRRARKRDVLAAVGAMQLLQIDTIHVVARSPYLVLFSRLGPYEPRWLDELLEEGALFECWAHEACFAPSTDLLLHRANLSERAHHWSMKHALRIRREHGASVEALIARVRESGPVKVADFEGERPAGTSGWWGWKAEKRWLEAAFALGELMVARRENFHRVYDLADRVLDRALPAWRTATTPPSEATRRAIVLKSVRALGVARARWVADYFRTSRKHKDEDFGALVESGDLVRVEVRGWDAPGYVHRDLVPLARQAAQDGLRATHTTLLSPFDPVVWDRARASAMFDFDYSIECYTPAAKRRYGYFVLPILHRGRLVGRLDAKAHRAEATFEVKAIYLEPDVTPTEALVGAVAGAIKACADWHATPRVVIRRSDPRALAAALRSRLRGAAERAA